MRGAAGLDPDHRWRQLGEETLDLSAPQPLLHDDASGRILAVHLENRFGNVEPDHASIHLDGPLCWSDIKAPAWHIRCRQGTVHPALQAKQSSLSSALKLDCFVASLLAMTARSRIDLISSRSKA